MRHQYTVSAYGSEPLLGEVQADVFRSVTGGSLRLRAIKCARKSSTKVQGPTHACQSVVQRA